MSLEFESCFFLSIHCSHLILLQLLRRFEFISVLEMCVASCLILKSRLLLRTVDTTILTSFTSPYVECFQSSIGRSLVWSNCAHKHLRVQTDQADIWRASFVRLGSMFTIIIYLHAHCIDHTVYSCLNLPLVLIYLCHIS